MKILQLVIIFIFISFSAFTQNHSSDSTKSFKIVETPPTYKAGIDELRKIIAQNLIYPDKAAKIGIEGKVYVTFNVQKDGSLRDFKIAQGIGVGCDEAAIQAIRMTGKWQPATIRGAPVVSSMAMPIIFQQDTRKANALIIINQEYLGRMKNLRNYFKNIKPDDITEIVIEKNKKTLKQHDHHIRRGDVGIFITLIDQK